MSDYRPRVRAGTAVFGGMREQTALSPPPTARVALFFRRSMENKLDEGGQYNPAVEKAVNDIAKEFSPDEIRGRRMMFEFLDREAQHPSESLSEFILNLRYVKPRQSIKIATGKTYEQWVDFLEGKSAGARRR